MEYVYQLNLPPLNEVLREDVMHRYEQSYDRPKFISYHPRELFKSEFLTITGFEWALAIDFYKPPGYIGLVHTDLEDRSRHVWGINWIWGAEGQMHYWHSANISPVDTIAGVDGYPIWIYPNDVPYDVSYHMDPGVYLVNASVPHQPISIGSRHCISLRPSTYDTPWENIVDKFKDYIL